MNMEAALKAVRDLRDLMHIAVQQKDPATDAIPPHTTQMIRFVAGPE